MRVKGEQKYDEYILIAPGSDYGCAMWSDIADLDNGRVLEKNIALDNKIINLIYHVHFSFAINNYVQLPLQCIWRNFYTLNKLKLDSRKRYCVIYTDVSAGRTDRKFLSNLKKKINVDIVLVMVNTMARRQLILKKRFQYFNYIFSFDKEDCGKYGFIYHPTNYSTATIRKNINIEDDAFYVGVSKGRQHTLENIFDKLKKAGAQSSFYISGVKKRNVLEIHYNEWLSYKQVLEHIEKANCIIEVMEEQQAGVTLRAMEAICYNKRLLTNNQSVKELPFYKSGFIQVFSSLEEINPSFVMDRTPIDYTYNNEFSPIHLIEHINQIAK